MKNITKIKINKNLKSTIPHMTSYLENVIRKVMLENKSDKSPKFNNARDAISWLDSR
jgi:hypothetical protein